jgi:hypothetical protein
MAPARRQQRAHQRRGVQRETHAVRPFGHLGRGSRSRTVSRADALALAVADLEVVGLGEGELHQRAVEVRHPRSTEWAIALRSV